MAYSGKYKVKNPTKYSGDFTNVIYRSLWEKYCFQWCDNNKDVKSWSSEEVVIPYLYEVDKRYHRYFMDLKITWDSGKTTLVEIKPHKETRPPTGQRRTKRYINEGLTYVKNMNKWEAANEYVKDRGWEFEIWTEVELRLMGILPKSVKKLKPLPKFSRKKTK
jgi:hypothetical protein